MRPAVFIRVNLEKVNVPRVADSVRQEDVVLLALSVHADDDRRVCRRRYATRLFEDGETATYLRNGESLTLGLAFGFSPGLSSRSRVRFPS